MAFFVTNSEVQIFALTDVQIISHTPVTRNLKFHYIADRVKFEKVEFLTSNETTKNHQANHES